MVQSFTRITQTTATMIDLIIITNEKQIQCQIHHTPKIADHSILTIQLPSQEAGMQKKILRDMKNFNRAQFQLDLMQCDWPGNLGNTDEMANYLVQKIIEKLDQHAPIIEREVSSTWGSKNWWTIEIQVQVSERDRLYRRAIITHQEEDWKEYRQQRNKVVQLIREQKQAYYHRKIDETKGDSKEMWKSLKLLIKSNKKNKGKKEIFFNDEAERDEKEIAEKFNKYFVESISDLVSNIRDTNILDITIEIETPLNKFNRFELLQLRDLRNIVKNMANKRSSVDGINIDILKASFEVIGQHFLQLINKSLERGCFPKDWKTSTIIPIEKIANTRKCEEYRPINMVPNYEKLLETVVKKQLRKFVEENRLLAPRQAGFRRKHCCESALQSVLSRWKTAISEKRLVGVVFLDFQRAFETINRKLLLQKLSKYGFEKNVFKWFSEYLETRTQQTKYNESISTVIRNEHGVPQGTVLGPDLFVLYINDIVKVVKGCELQLFADDTILYFESNNINVLIETINDDLKRLSEWLYNNSLRVNVKKTKFMVIKNKYNQIDTYMHDDVMIEQNKLEQVKECKYLGVMIDENLTFSSHAKYVTKKITTKINLLGRISRDLTKWTKILIYKTIILPHLNFCASILFMFTKGDIDTLQKNQNRALRYILRCNRYTRIKDMLMSTNLLSVSQNIYFNTMIVIYKIRNGMYPEHIMEDLQLVGDVHDYNTRTRLHFYVPCVGSSFAQNSLFHRGLIEFNNLPIDIKSSNFTQFKKLLRIYVVSNIEI